MNITIIYGTVRKASTYNCVQLLLNNIKLNIDIKVTEFFLPRDLPYFCRECHSCLINLENTCPHFNDSNYIITSLDESDLIILACPVFKCDISSNMKLLLDNLSYKSIKNKSNSFMSKKIGLVMSTAAGAGLFYTTETLKKNLAFWGINNIFKFSSTIYEMNWKDVNLTTKKKIQKKLFNLSCKILNLYTNSSPIKAPIINKITFLQKRTTFKEYHCEVIDFIDCKDYSYSHDKNIQ